MSIVTAGMHHGNLLTAVIFSRNFARVGQPGFLLHRQRIHVGAHERCRPLAILHHADNAEAGEAGLVVFADGFGDFAAGGFQILGHNRSRAFFMAR